LYSSGKIFGLEFCLAFLIELPSFFYRNGSSAWHLLLHQNFCPGLYATGEMSWSITFPQQLHLNKSCFPFNMHVTRVAIPYGFSSQNEVYANMKSRSALKRVAAKILKYDVGNSSTRSFNVETNLSGANCLLSYSKSAFVIAFRKTRL